MKPESASQIGYEAMRRQLANHRFVNASAVYQAEMLYKHYLSHTTAMMQLRQLVGLWRQCEDDASRRRLESAIEYIVAEVKRKHIEDFGISLETSNDQKLSHDDRESANKTKGT